MNSKYDKIYNTALISFLFLFIATLNNSIFLNQIGYFGALLLIVYKSLQKKEIQFQKTGLEVIFLLFISAEVLSTLFAVDSAQSFHNLLKRVLLIPVVYTVFSSVNDYADLRKVFYLFLAASIITFSIYLFDAYKHFASHLYQIESKGPSTFQYVMTAGGLISFTTIFLFAYVINEKQKLTWKILSVILFTLSFIALLASYTRAAWIGALAGLFIILVVKRIWLIVVPASVAALYLLFGISTISEVKVLNLNSKEEKVVETEGRAWNLFADSSIIIQADYQNGINILDSELNLKNNYALNYPAVNVDKLNDSTIFAASVNLELFLFDIRNNQIREVSKFYTKGRSIDFDVYQTRLYVLDLDSGLTIFNNPSDFVNYPEFNNFNNISIDNNHIAGYSTKEKRLKIYNLKNGFIDSLLFEDEYDFYSGFVWVSDSVVFVQRDSGLKIYKFTSSNLLEIGNQNNLNGIKSIRKYKSKIFALSFDNKIYEIFINNMNLTFELVYKNEYNISDFYPYKDQLVITQNKINRFASIIDPYHDTNLERFNQWSAGLRMFEDYPLFGVGDIDLHKLYKEYKKPFEKFTYGHLHNNYVHLLVILGSYGFIIVMMMLFMILKKHYVIYSTVKNEKLLSTISLGSFASFVGFLVSGLAEWNFGDHEIITMVWFTLALNLAVNKIYKLQKK